MLPGPFHLPLPGSGRLAKAKAAGANRSGSPIGKREEKRGSKRQDGHDRKHRESQCQNGGGGSKISTGHDGGSFSILHSGVKTITLI